MNELARKLAYLPYTAYRQVRWLGGDRSQFGATLKLTTHCTLHCRHCPWLQDSRPDLPTERWKELIREVRDRGARHLVMEGGEPALREDLQELITFAQRLGMKVTLATNATRPLDQYTPDRFLISIDGLAETHDRLRGSGAFARLLENLPTARPPRHALISLSRQNIGEAVEVLEFFAGKLEGFWFSFVYDYEGRERLALSAAEKGRAGQMLIELKSRFPIINKSSYLQRLGRPRPCRDWLLTTVTADGEIHSGCMISALEPCRCDECELACHREFSDFLEPRYYLSHLRDYLRELGR